jgi:hypothetical protein
MKQTYHVPVYFEITAESAAAAEAIISKELDTMESFDQIPDYRVGMAWLKTNKETATP